MNCIATIIILLFAFIYLNLQHSPHFILGAPLHLITVDVLEHNLFSLYSIPSVNLFPEYLMV